MQIISKLVPLVSEEARQKADERVRALLNDKDVKEFILNHALSSDEIYKSITAFNEYVLFRDKGENVRLVYNVDYVYITHAPKDEATAQRMRDGIRTKSEYDDVTRAFEGVTFDDIKLDEHNTLIVQAFKKRITEYSYKSGKTGVWLYGKFGRGKSYLMGAVASEFCKKGVAVTYITSVGLMNDISKALDYNDYGSIRERADSLKKAEVLILDDMGAENARDYGYKSVLYDILDNRAKDGLITFFTSNLSIDEYTELVAGRVSVKLDAERMQERIEMLGKQIILLGENKRRKA